MILIVRKIDVRPIIGAAVVFLIIGLIIFCIYYFAIAKPAADALEASKLSALSQVASLNAIGTSQAISDASMYTSQIQAAGSKAEVESILIQVSSSTLREQKRKEMLDLAETAASGTFYTSDGRLGTTAVTDLSALLQSLKAGINAKTTISDLEAYRAEFDDQATLTWREIHKEVLEGFAENRVGMSRNSPPYGEFMMREDALAYVAGQSWQTLRKLKFEKATVRVPILDTFQRTPTIKTGSVVKVYAYDIEAENMELLYANATVRNVIYSQADIATIAWALMDGAVTQTYSTDMWETLKAAAAGDPEAAAVGWSEYGSDLMDRALKANIGAYTVSVIYVVEVTDSVGERIVEYEFHKTATKDIILVPIV